MRYDFFLIWGNGLQFTEEIIDKIRNDKNLAIITILRYPIKQRMQKFINKVYAYDSTPRRHLRGKTKYLQTCIKCCVFVLVKNLDPIETCFGQGRFRTVQCKRIVELKKDIRNCFNPRLDDPNTRIAPLNRGVSHEHCVHASDNEKQVDHFLKVLELPNLNYFKRNDEYEYEIPWHVEVRKITPKVRKLDELFISNTKQSLTRVSDSLHVKYLKGNKQPYIDYFYANFYFGQIPIDDHFPIKFDQLIRVFNPNFKGLNGKMSKIIINKNNVILDGAHRAAILYELGYEEAKCIQI